MTCVYPTKGLLSIPTRQRILLATALVLVDDTLPGADATVRNHRGIFDALCAMTIGTVHQRDIVIKMSMTRDPIATLLACIKDTTRVAQTMHADPVLYLVINGHSTLYRGQDAIDHATKSGETPFLARDGSTVRFSCLRYNGTDILTPSMTRTLLETIRDAGIRRTLVFFDTCHSMSLVSALLCPAIDLRIIHSSGEDEKTWQDQSQGSVMSCVWAQACAQRLEALAHLDSSLRTQALLTILYETIQTAAKIIASQILTAGPSHEFWVF